MAPLRRTPFIFREKRLRRDGGPYGIPSPRDHSVTYDHLLRQQHNDITGADGLPGKLRVLHEELDVCNSLEQMVTFDVRTKEWTAWHRPLRQFQNGTATYVAASGLERVLGLARPLCPHAANPFRDRTTCEMYVHSRTVRGLQQWVFQSQHKCDYIIHIPRMRSNSRYILKDTGRGDWDWNDHSQYQEHDGVSTEPASSPPPVASGSSGGSTSSSFRRSQYENLASSLDTHGFELCKSPELEEDAAGVDGDADELELYFGKGKGRA